MDNRLSVLMVEDSQSDAGLIVRHLQKAGYDVVFERVETAAAMQAALARPAWDIVIADYRLPQFDAPAALRMLQESGQDIPFILVSGHIGEEAAVEMMKAGAHDYVMKDTLARLAPAVARELRDAETRRRRRQTEEALRVSEAEYSNLFEQAHDSIFIVDLTTHRFLDVNENAARRLGYTRPELLQLTYDDIDSPTAARRKDAILRSLQEIGSAVFEHVHRRKDGSEMPVEISAQTIEYRGCQVLQCFARDISARKRTEATWQALNTAAVTLQQAAPNETEIYQAASTQLAALGLRGAVLTVDEATDSFVFAHLFLPPRLLTALERLTGLTGAGLRIPRARVLVLAQAFESGQALYIASSATQIAAKLLPESASWLADQVAEMLGPANAILAPLRMEDRVGGLLYVAAAWLSAADAPAITAFADQMSAALENARLLATERRRAQESATLLATAQAISSLHLDDVLETIASRARALFQADGSRIHLLEPDGRTLRCVVALHERAEAALTTVLQWGEGITGRVALQGAPEIVNQALADPDRVQMPGTPLEAESLALAPLQARGEVIGVMTVTRLGEERPFGQDDLTFLTALANQAAIAIENARLYRETQQLAAFNQSLIQSMAEGIVVQDAGGVFTFVNPAATAMLGYRPDELVGLPGTTIVPPDQQPSVQDADARRLRGEVDRYELELIGKDGQRITVLVSGVPRTDSQGRFAGTMSVFTDISERKRADEALRESEARYRVLAENAFDGIVISMQGVIVEANPQFARMFGYKATELVDKSILELVAPDDRQLVMGNLRAGYDQPYQARALRRDGTEIVVEARGQATTYQGRPARLTAVRDVTQRRRAQAERERLAAQVRAQARELQQIMDTVPTGVLLLDAAGRVMQANPVAENDLDVLAGAQVGDVLTHLGDRALADLLTSPPTRGVWHEVQAQGRTFEIIARPMHNGRSSENWVLVVNEVTREREIAAQLQQQERLAIVGQMAAGIAHDFNNILAAIVLYTQLLNRAPELTEHSQKRVTVINEQAWHASRLIEQILDFSRQSVLERQPLDLLPLLKEQVKLLERTLPEHIMIELDYGQADYTVQADPTRMQQMLTNLAVNARDAMPDGGILRIGLERLRVEDEAAPPAPGLTAGEWIHLTVSDTGTGIAPDTLAHIFEPFFTTKEVGKGTGLGLAQVHGIVGQHGGRIDVETQVGAGTTFAIFLPALETSRPQPSLPNIMAIPHGQGETLLVVEDGETLRRALAASLVQLNYRVLEAANGVEAWAIIEARGNEIALVLSDVVMPEMGGVTLFRSLQQQGWGIPVILLSGHPMGEELDELRAQGLVAWLTKPPHFERLAQVIDAALHG